MVMGVGTIFSKGAIVDFSTGRHKDISRERAKVVKFHFFFSKLRKRPFFAKNVIEKCLISKSRGARPLPPSDAHAYGHDFWIMTEIILAQGQATVMRILRRARGVTPRQNCEIC